MNLFYRDEDVRLRNDLNTETELKNRKRFLNLFNYQFIMTQYCLVLFDGEKTFRQEGSEPRFFYITAESKPSAVLKMFKNKKIMSELVNHFDIAEHLEEEGKVEFLGMTLNKDYDTTEEDIIDQISSFYSPNATRFIADSEKTWNEMYAFALVNTRETMFRLIKSKF